MARISQSYFPNIGSQQKQVTFAAIFLMSRQVLVHLIHLATAMVLGRMLLPEAFGMYAMTLFFLGALLPCAGLGLSANIVRQHQAAESRELSALFAFQLAWGSILACLLWLIAPHVAHFYHFDKEVLLLVRCFAIALWFSIWQLIPQLQLERELNFRALARMEIMQASIFNITILVGARYDHIALGCGIALCARALAGSFYTQTLYPSVSIPRWNQSTLKKYLRFGWHFQASSWISILKDAINPFFLGGLAGLHAVGVIQWSGMFAALPVFALMALQRLYLPLFSRYQHHPQQLVRWVEAMLAGAHCLVAPIALSMWIWAQDLTRLLFGPEWLDSLPIYHLLWWGNLLVPTSTVVIALINALGHARMAFNMALIWAVGTWMLGAPMISLWSTTGFAVANLLVQLTNLFLFFYAQRIFPFNWWEPMLRAWAAGFVAILILSWFIHPASSDITVILGFMTMVIAGLIAAVVACLPFWKQLGDV